MKNYAKITENRIIIFNFFLKADIEDQYMHLDSTFNALSNGTNYNPNSIDKWVILG